MKPLLALFAVITFTSAFAAEWMQPSKTEGDFLTYVGYIQVERDKLYDARAKEFNGNYFISDTPEGGKRTPLYADWDHVTSRIVGLKAKITAKIRHMKSGDQVQIITLEILNEK
jgi:hypothetical protein